jgi:capsular polysaccharide transport system permease protein
MPSAPRSASLAKRGAPPPGGGGAGAAAWPAGGAGFLPRFSLLDHLFIIRALALRDLKIRHRKTGRLGFLVEFVMPLIVILIHYYVFIILNHYMPAGIPVELYVMGGFNTWFVYKYTATRRTNSGERGPGAIFMPGVTPMHVLAAAAAWEAAVGVLILFVGLALSEAIFGDIQLPNIPLILVVFSLTAVVGTGSRLIFEALSGIWPVVKGIKKAIIFGIFLTSGIYFSASSNSPDLLKEYSWYNPLLHLIEYQRHAIFPGYPIARVTLLYPIACAFGLTLIGLMLRRWLHPWAHD